MRIKYTPLILLLILPFLNSCIDNADFDQINLDLEPIVNVPLVYFELNQLDFLDDTGTVEVEAITDITDLEIFQSTVVRDNLIKADFDFAIRNTFERFFFVQMELLNANNNVVYTFNTLNIPPSMQAFSSTEIIEVSENPEILTARRARVTLRMNPVSTTLSPDVERRLEFRSTGTFHLRF